MSEATRHPHNVHRRTFLNVDGLPQPAPAPRFSATPAADPTSAEFPGASTTAVLRDWGIDAARIESLVAAGAVKQA
jgi:alpha-methylacyl-CoA racemase